MGQGRQEAAANSEKEKEQREVRCQPDKAHVRLGGAVSCQLIPSRYLESGAFGVPDQTWSLRTEKGLAADGKTTPTALKVPFWRCFVSHRVFVLEKPLWRDLNRPQCFHNETIIFIA